MPSILRRGPAPYRIQRANSFIARIARTLVAFIFYDLLVEDPTTLNTLHSHGYIYWFRMVVDLLHCNPYLGFPEHDLDISPITPHDYVIYLSTQYIARLSLRVLW
jgi:hypothetical protein